MEKFELLGKVENFWDKRNEPATEADFHAFETSNGIIIPNLIKSLYLVSNGGFPDFRYVKSGNHFHSMFFEWIPAVKKFELFKGYVGDFGLDDEETLNFFNKDTNAVIWHRHGFEYFVLFWPNSEPNICDLGILDLAAPEGDPSRLVKFQVGSDPVGVFARRLK